MSSPFLVAAKQHMSSFYSVAEPLRFVDHTYHDYSRYLEQGGPLIKHKKSTDNFPARLHRMLSNEEHSDVICWMVRGHYLPSTPVS